MHEQLCSCQSRAGKKWKCLVQAVYARVLYWHFIGEDMLGLCRRVSGLVRCREGVGPSGDCRAYLVCVFVLR